jgi:hypothetical protein
MMHASHRDARQKQNDNHPTHSWSLGRLYLELPYLLQ